MYCPKCGNKLVEIERVSSEPTIDWMTATEKEIDRYVELCESYKPVERLEYACSKGCFESDFPLYFHNPFQGINSAPGDSWSLSWIK